MMKTYSITILVLTFLVLASSPVFGQTEATYTVKNGDTLYNISKRLNVTIAELKAWNDISGNDIELGQQLVYYRPEEGQTQQDSVSEEPSEPLINRSEGSQNEFYIVKSGDTLYEIAQEHDMSVSQLQSLNNLTDTNLRIGQRLAVKKKPSNVAPNVAQFLEESAPQGVFSVYEVKSGESPEEVLSRFKMTEAEFERLNPELNINQVMEGQQVTVLLPPSRNYDNPYLQKANLQTLGEVSVSRYEDGQAGTTTTNGELYDPESLTAAHSNIALGSIIFVENAATGNGVYVKVNDRITGNGIKLSEKAYNVLNLTESGQSAVSIYTEVND